MRSLLIATLLLAFPVPARAEIFATPFLGIKFGGGTTYFDPDFAGGAKKFAMGGSVTVIGAGVIGYEGLFGYVPEYFDGDNDLIKPGSFIIDATGSVLLALPTRMTGGGLRPYASIGAGIVHGQSVDSINVLQVRRTVPVAAVGGGVWGLLTNNVGVRLDYRYFRSLTTDNGSVAHFGRQISYSRFTIGLLLRL